ncbi:MAG TPA: hypothetical protein VFC33_09520 [Acidimicrobiia bacterium]|nr:hypothetical protein [Acidimicrobiia bacterium]
MRRARMALAAAFVVALLTTACSHGPSRLAPLHDDGSRGATAAPAAGSQAGLRAAMEKLLDVAPPAGYEAVGPDTDLEPDELGPELSKRFAGLGFERSMERIYATDTGTVHLVVYAFASQAGAQQAAGCDCGDPVPGVAGAWAATSAAGVELEGAAGSYLVRVLDDSGPGARPVAELATFVTSVRTAVGGADAAGGITA